MHEFAILNEDGSIQNVVMTGKTLEQLRETYGKYVVPLDEVPLRIRQNYEFWDTRP